MSTKGKTAMKPLKEIPESVSSKSDELELILVCREKNGESSNWEIRIPEDGSRWTDKCHVTLVQQEFSVGMLMSLETREEFQRQGLARKVYKATEKVARQNGINALVAYIAVENDVSKQFHSAMGFKSVCTFPMNIRGGKEGEMWVKTLK